MHTSKSQGPFMPIPFFPSRLSGTWFLPDDQMDSSVSTMPNCVSHYFPQITVLLAVSVS